MNEEYKIYCLVKLYLISAVTILDAVVQFVLMNS